MAKQLREEYLSLFPKCQYADCIPRTEVDRCGNLFGREAPILCIEHIGARHGKHSEHWSNYATVCPRHHDWKHANEEAGRVAIWHLKRSLAVETGDWRHFDLQAIRDGFGWYLPGWIETRVETGRLPSWAEDLARELLESM